MLTSFKALFVGEKHFRLLVVGSALCTLGFVATVPPPPPPAVLSSSYDKATRPLPPPAAPATAAPRATAPTSPGSAYAPPGYLPPPSPTGSGSGVVTIQPH